MRNVWESEYLKCFVSPQFELIFLHWINLKAFFSGSNTVSHFTCSKQVTTVLSVQLKEKEALHVDQSDSDNEVLFIEGKYWQKIYILI